ncbi:MAG: cation diffusion facilitator family transporter [Planctomyces sp.]
MSPLQRNTLIGLGASILLAAAQLVAGIVGCSTALIADSIESLADSIGSLLVWQALKVAARPADDRHPWGYGKAEAVASLLTGVLLLAAAVLMTVQSIHEILIPHQAPAWWTLLLLATVTVIKELLFRFMIRHAAAETSDAATADAWHQRSDAITSAAAFIGVSVAVWGPELCGLPALIFADEAAAILASGIILMTAWKLAGPALAELLDADAPQLSEHLRSVAEHIPGVKCVEKVRVRKSGAGWLAELHVQVDPLLPIRTAHAVGGQVRAELRSAVPGIRDALIHVEPYETDNSGGIAGLVQSPS